MTNSKPSRRQFLSIAAAATAAATVTPPALSTAQVSSPGPPGADEELVLINGRIHTMDARNTIASVLTGLRSRTSDSAVAGVPAVVPRLE